ncbi:MFS transporter [Lichenicoccus sp.]|uniref:MFS transporter n=1 Tax=Lichenicoccus sp. TaxID=2781899 RepID=UPI003D117697
MSVSLRDAMNEARIGRLQWAVAAMLIGVMMLDGFDLQIAAFSATRLMSEWHLSKLQFSPLLAAAMIGMAFGSLLGSWAGDRYGRKPSLVASVAWFGAMTLICATASSPRTFILYRFLSGLGLGAAFPIATTLMNEWMPPRAAGKAISIMTLGIPAGIVVGALAASRLLPRFGWHSCFAGAGILCLLFSLCLLWQLPESPGYLLLKNRQQEAYAVLSRAWKRSVDNRPDVFRLEPKRESGRGLLRRSNARVNLGLWLGVLSASFGTYSIGSWVTVILVGLRLPLATALRGPLTFSLSAISGALVVGWLLLRLGSRLTMLLLALLILVSAAAMSAAAYTLPPGGDLFRVLFTGLAFAGFGYGGLQAALYVLAAAAYDTSIRARGVGVAALMGRLGVILSSFVGAAVLALGHESGFFALIAVLAAVTAAGVVVVDRHIPRAGGTYPAPSSLPGSSPFSPSLPEVDSRRSSGPA